MSEKKGEKDLIVVKKGRKHGHGHHGGSWKIAYADFVTAMMAFFLLMWLTTALNKAQKEGISDYFKEPLHIASIGGNNMGSRMNNVKGGGEDFTKVDGQVSAKQTANGEKKAFTPSQPQEQEQLDKLKANITQTVNSDPALVELKDRMLMDTVAEGLRIQLIDNKNKPMFGMGSDDMDPEMQPIFNKIAILLNSVPNRVSIQGHTDANPYTNPENADQSNWDLSTQRANAARRILLKGGMQEDKVMEVSGFASTVLLDKTNPLSPNNRRISIIVMKKEFEDKIMKNN